MGLLSQLVTLPLAPARAAWWTIGQVVDHAAREYYSPATVRSELAELSRRLDAGLISDEEFDRREDELLDRLAEGQQQGFAG
jgi:cytochrome c-type biogenesis protein CcmH/NrfG